MRQRELFQYFLHSLPRSLRFRKQQRSFSCRRRYFFPESDFTDDVHDEKTGPKKNRIQNKELKIRIAVDRAVSF